MALTIIQKPVRFSDGSTSNGVFATDGTNLYPVTMIVDSLGNLVGNSTNNTGTGYSSTSKTAVSGTFSTTGQSATFTILGGRGISIAIGVFTGSIQLEKNVSTLGWLPLKSQGIQLCIWTSDTTGFIDFWSDDEAGAQYRLNCTALTGTAGYNISQF